MRPSLALSPWYLRLVRFALAIAVVASAGLACKPANMSGAGGKKAGGVAKDDHQNGEGDGTDLGGSAPGQANGIETTNGVSTASGTETGEYNDSPVTIPASMSGAFLVCPMVETAGRSEVDEGEDLFGCAATPDNKGLLPLDGYDVEWSVEDALGGALAAVQSAPPTRSLFHRLFVLEASQIKSTTTVRATIFDRATATKLKVLEGLVLVGKRAPFPQAGDADKVTTCHVCSENTASGTGTGL